MSAGRKHCRTTSRPEKIEPFISFTLPELMALTPVDFDELDDLQGEPEGTRLWWQLRRALWAEEGTTP